MNGRLINIDETLNAVCGAISEAEHDLREQIKLYYQEANEEFITFAFYGHIRHKLREASQNKIIEKAFLKDLKAALRRQRYSERSIDQEIERQLSRHASGLVADIVLHNRTQEGETGGDFGLVIVHPELTTSSNTLVIKKGASSGLLCQAKIKRKNGRWGDLSNQRDVLPAHLDFASLVLYSYLDVERSELNPVAWKLCKGLTLPDLELSLKKDVFGEALGTVDVIRRLGRSEIGTNDQTLIDEFVSPSARQHLEIKIYWPKDTTPEEPVKIRIQQKPVVRQKVSVIVRRS